MKYTYRSGIQKVKVKLINLSTALVVALTGLSGAAPLFMSGVAHADPTTVPVRVDVDPNGIYAGNALEEIEFKNNSAKNVDLSNIVITQLDFHNSGAPTESVLYTFGTNVVLSAGDHYEICADSTPSCDAVWSGGERLNNDGDKVTFYAGSVNQGNQLGFIKWNTTPDQRLSKDIVLP
ncbi:MAG TPA: hypothetical protein VFL85_03430, partial [Candidatus Saccharimonadales bacterium]|nr:hypothetical protein [Candidatus Saccharimonadales bacterium]